MPDLRSFVTSRIQPTDATRLSPEELDNNIVLGVGRLIADPNDPTVDRQRVVEWVAARTGLSTAEASAKLQEVETKAKQLADTERSARVKSLTLPRVRAHRRRYGVPLRC